MRNLIQSQPANLMILMVSLTDGSTGVTGLTLSCNLSKNGGAFSAIAPVIEDRGFGWYNIALTSSHTDTVGDLVLHVEAAGVYPSDSVSSVGVVTGSITNSTLSIKGADDRSITQVFQATEKIDRVTGLIPALL